MTCKRSEQCDHADICRFAQSDDYNLLGGSCFVLKDPQTNEEWMKQCNTEQLAEVLARYVCGWTTNHSSYEMALHSFSEWLKQPHKE